MDQPRKNWERNERVQNSDESISVVWRIQRPWRFWANNKIERFLIFPYSIFELDIRFLRIVSHYTVVVNFYKTSFRNMRNNCVFNHLVRSKNQRRSMWYNKGPLTFPPFSKMKKTIFFFMCEQNTHWVQFRIRKKLFQCYFRFYIEFCFYCIINTYLSLEWRETPIQINIFTSFKCSFLIILWQNSIINLYMKRYLTRLLSIWTVVYTVKGNRRVWDFIFRLDRKKCEMRIKTKTNQISTKYYFEFDWQITTLKRCKFWA